MDQPLEVQIAAREKARHKAGFGYWMEMGLGKTYTTLQEFMELVATREATRLVVVCPNSFKGGWVEEIRKQQVNCDPFIYESGADNGWWLRKKFESPPVLIVNYEAVRREQTQEYIRQFIRGRSAVLAIDEGIQIKTYNSQQTKAILELGTEFSVVRDLTGKPQTQGPHDLWAQLRVIRVPEVKKMNFFVFRNTFCRMGGYLNKKVVGAQNEELLASWIDPWVFWAKKSDWTDLPPKMYTIRECKLSGEHLRMYRSMEEEFVTWLSEEEFVTVDMALTKYVKLAQIQFGFLIDDNGKTHELVDPENNPRINAIIDILEEIPGKLVIVYQHKYARDALLLALAQYNPVTISGGQTAEEVGEAKRVFNTNSYCRAILVQTIRGKYGHTLVGMDEDIMRCSTMAFAENTWSLDNRSQLEDRIHRHGQTGESCLYIDFASTPLDRRIARALQEKENVFGAVFQHIGVSLPSGVVLTDPHEPDDVV